MISKTITYDTYNGAKKTKEFFFHINQTEFAILNSEIPGGIEKYVQNVMNEQDEMGLLKLIDLLVRRSYGVMDPADDEFTKIGTNGRPLFEKFMNSDAYDKLIVDIIHTENGILDFMIGILPEEKKKEMKARLAELEAEAKKNGGNLTPLPTAQQH